MASRTGVSTALVLLALLLSCAVMRTTARRLEEAEPAPKEEEEFPPHLPVPKLPVPEHELPPFPDVHLPPKPELPEVELPPKPELPEVELPPKPELPEMELPPKPELPEVELPPKPELPAVPEFHFPEPDEAKP